MASKAAPKTLADFNAEHNPDVKIPAKIQAAITSLLTEGKEAWEYEADFMKRCPGIGNGNFAKYRAQFEKHIVVVKQDGRNAKNVWFADPKVAAKARGQG
jgi:hypothetical protein